MTKKISRYQIATAIAIFFHCIGIAGLLFFDRHFFVQSTPLNLLLSFLLLLWTQQIKNAAFFLFMALVVVMGYFSEVAGVNTGLLFGDYSYGRVLGVQWLQVPLLIGINWFIIIYCCGICTQTLLLKVINRGSSDFKEPPVLLKVMSVIVDGATLAVAFDWLMEPVAIKLGFWFWHGDGRIPLYNYISWFIISMVLLTIFHFCRFNKQNKFAVNLLLIQAMFFLILRTFLN
ncbi:MAG: carotenoid biosynthesis protein [Ferruginibacter sp.]|nr:carotenoid biosynthesis protein [Ferruginibacter sp.]